jgi:hypothetical protein
VGRERESEFRKCRFLVWFGLVLHERGSVFLVEVFSIFLLSCCGNSVLLIFVRCDLEGLFWLVGRLTLRSGLHVSVHMMEPVLSRSLLIDCPNDIEVDTIQSLCNTSPLVTITSIRAVKHEFKLSAGT